MKSLFYRGWLFLGLFQIFLMSCHTPATSQAADLAEDAAADLATNGMFSNIGPNEASASLLPTAPLALAGYNSPVRLSRTFFERSLAASVRVMRSDLPGVLLDEQGSADWSETAPTQPPLEPGALADFRDRQGCAGLRTAAGLSLCFTITPDLSSVDLSPSKLSVQDPQAVLGGCTGQSRLVRLDRQKSRVLAEFELRPTLAELRTGCLDVGISVKWALEAS